MQGKSQHKKITAGISAVFLAVLMAVSVCFGLTTNRSASAAEPATGATILTYVTSNGMPSGTATGDMFISSSGKNTMTGDFEVLVNSTSNLASKPSADGIVIDFMSMVNGVDKHLTISLNPADNNAADKATTWAVVEHAPGEDTEVGDDGAASPGTPTTMTFVQAKDSNGNLMTVPRSEIAYNVATGVLTLNSKYQSYEDIAIYNYVSKNQINTTHKVYGAYKLDGQEKTLSGSQISFSGDSAYGNMKCYQLGTNAGGAPEPAYNAIMHEMQEQGGSLMYAGYRIDSSKIVVFSAVVSADGKIISKFPMTKGADYTVLADGTIKFDDSVMSDNIIIISEATTNNDLVPPKVKSKTSTSLTFYAAPGYTYKLYKEDKTTVVDTKTGSKGVVSFTDLPEDPDGNPVLYYIQAIPPASSGLEPSELKKVRTDGESKPFEFSFEEGDTFEACVYVGGHWSGTLDIEGVSGKLGHTIFSCEFTDIRCDNEELKQLLWENKDFRGSCYTPGAGYSTGHSKWASGRVLKVDNENRSAKVLVVMEGDWYAGGKPIQNIVANITLTGEPTGSIEIMKTSTDPNSLNNPYYDFDGIAYTVTGEDTGFSRDITLETTEDGYGYGKMDGFPIDTYEVVETDTNDWYQLNEETYTVEVNADTTNNFKDPVRVKNGSSNVLKDEPKYVELDLTKVSANPDITNHNTAIYDIRGAEYTIRCTTPLKEQRDMNIVSNWLPKISGQADTIMITQGDSPTTANAKSGKLLYGDYEVYETKEAGNAIKSYAIDPTVYEIKHDKFTIGESYHITKADAKGSVDSAKSPLDDNPDVDFSFRIQKLDEQFSEKYGQGKGNLSAVFEVRYYNTLDDNYDSSKPFDKWYVRTDENGYADLDFIKNYPVVSGIWTMMDETTPYSFSQNPDNGGRYYTKKNAAGEEHVVMPVGYVEIQEVVAPDGYLFDSGTIRGPGQVYKYRNTPVVNSQEYNTNAAVNADFGTVKEHVYRGDLQFIKKRGGSGDNAAMSKIPFILESLTTGEKHLIVTDENGHFDSSYAETSDSMQGIAHTRDTNYNDKLLAWTPEGQPYITDDDALRYDVGTYFFGYGPKSELTDKKHEVDNSVGALPYDDYVLTEVRCPRNEGLELIRDTFTVSRNKKVYNKGEIEDYPSRLHTTATDANTNGHSGLITGETVMIQDEVTYEGLKENSEYTMKGILMDKETNAPLTDANGNTFTAEQKFKTPEHDTQGTVTMVFEVPAELVKGKSTVVFEDCYDEFGIKIAYHTDINDEGQTVTYPSVHTTATDSVTGDHEGNLLDEEVTVVDAVKCDGLTIGKQYTIKGVLMDRETGKRLVDDEGHEFTAEETFTADAKEMTVELKFTVPSKVIAGKTVVAFEDLYYDGKIIGSHADLNDEEQTVYYPAIRTTATDSVTKSHDGLANETITINDLVEYENLIKGETYTISGTIMDKSTGEALKGPDGKEFVASTTFVAGEDAASSEALKEANALVKAYLETADKMLELYGNMTDAEKAAVLENMKLDTMPAFSNDAIKAAVDAAVKDGSTAWTDEQKDMLKKFDDFYLALTADQQKETGELVSVEKLTGAVDAIAADAKAKAEKADKAEGTEGKEDANVDAEGNANSNNNGKPERVSGSVIVSFEIPSDIVHGKTTVVFENLYFGEEPNDENHKAKHEDINDEGQTVTYPEIGTMATIDGQKIAPARDVITITDTIEYKGLTPGQEYTFTGKLMDKTTNETVKNADGTEVTGETTFIPEQADGTTEVVFTFNAMAIQFHDVVVFEEAYRKSDVADETILVAEHKDIEDADQTVRIDDAGLADELIETGPLMETGDIVFYILVVAIILTGSYWFAFRHRKRNLFD